MSNHGKHDQPHVAASTRSTRARIQALLFTAASIGTTLLTLGILDEGKLPRYLGE
jgi:hypothetical protein